MVFDWLLRAGAMAAGALIGGTTLGLMARRWNWTCRRTSRLGSYATFGLLFAGGVVGQRMGLPDARQVLLRSGPPFAAYLLLAAMMAGAGMLGAWVARRVGSE